MSAEIEKYLGTVMESTAKTIASRIGLDQLDVARELNRMKTDGIVEREKRHGNEYVYWLVRVDAPTALAAAPEVAAPVAASAQEESDREQKLSDLLDLLGVDADSQFKLFDAIAGANALITARDELNAKFRTAADRATNLQIELTKLTQACDAARAEVESQKSVIAKLKENAAALEQSIDDLTGVADVQLPKVYVTVGRYAKPKRHADLPRAQRRAAALVRNEKESEVLVLAPVGRMVRGSEWRSQ